MILTPPPELTISDWADANRRLSSEASAEPGQWRTSRAEYQRGMMDAISDGAVESVVIMSSAQVGKALAIDTPMATPDGWTTMGALRSGDIIFDETGAPCRVAGLAIATSLLSGCATVRSEDGRLAACPPVVEYGREFQARAAEELARLPEGSMIAEMPSDYAVMRNQARTC